MTQLWPWVALAGLGAFHGVNPAMGWLFAVALGLHRQSAPVVFTALVPITAGHLASVAAVAGLLAAFGILLPHHLVKQGAGLLLLGWAAYHWRYGHRQRVRFGMTSSMIGLALWSFLMATAHGAGLMLWPALMPICFPSKAPGTLDAGLVTTAVAGLLVHTGAMVATTAAVAALVYGWLGVGILRQTWVNVDAAWMVALTLTGLVLVLS